MGPEWGNVWWGNSFAESQLLPKQEEEEGLVQLIIAKHPLKCQLQLQPSVTRLCSQGMGKKFTIPPFARSA